MSQLLSRIGHTQSDAPEPSTIDEVTAFVQRNLRRNLAAGIVDAVFFALATQIISNETVIPLLVTALSGSTVVLGLVGAAHNLGHFMPQLFVAGYTEQRRYKKPITLSWGGVGARLPFLLIGLAVWAWGARAPGLALAAFVILRTLSAITLGMVIPAWVTLIGKVIPTTRRGVFLGFGRGLGALLGVGGALLAGHLLETQPYPRNFALCFILAAIAVFISWLGLAAHKEPPDLVIKPKTPMMRFFASLPGLVRGDPNYGRFLVARAVAVLGSMAMSFFIVDGALRFDLTGREVGLLTATISVFTGVFYLIWGAIADRVGHKTVLCAGALTMAGASLTALVTPVLGGLYVAFGLIGATLSAEAISASNIILEFAPNEERPTYIGLTNTLLAPCRTLAPIVGGSLASIVGFPGLFVTAAALSIVGTVLMILRVREPRMLRPTLM
jgi:MFS family permease